jgi:hypothetical protein
MSSLKQKKNRITVLLGANATGKEKLPPFFIGRAAKPRCFKGKIPQDEGFDYNNNKRAWMTQALFVEWLKELDQMMAKENRKILLFLDNAMVQPTDVSLNNITLEFLPPNTTSRMQPLDAGIIASFKRLKKNSSLCNSSR